jgi:hypothetical protein
MFLPWDESLRRQPKGSVIPSGRFWKACLSDFLSVNQVHKDYAEDRKRLRKWLIVGLLKSVFSAKTDTLLAAVRATLQNNEGPGFPFDALDKTLMGHGISLKFSDSELNALLDAEYGKRNTFSVLAAAYPALNTQFRFHLDHIYPKSGFDRRKLKKADFLDEDIELYLG